MASLPCIDPIQGRIDRDFAATRRAAQRPPNSGDRNRDDMKLSWIILAIVGWAIGALVVLVLCRMAGNQDRVARRSEKRLFPYSDVTITRFGND